MSTFNSESLMRDVHSQIDAFLLTEPVGKEEVTILMTAVVSQIMSTMAARHEKIELIAQAAGYLQSKTVEKHSKENGWRGFITRLLASK